MKSSLAQKVTPPVLMALFLIAVFELLAAFGWLNEALFPPPHDVLATLLELREDFRGAFFETASATLVGYFASAALGFFLAVGFSLSPRLGRAVLPFAIFFQTVPIIAIAPLLVIYFGFGPGTVMMSALIVAIFPVLANTLLGLESIDAGELELFKLYRAGRWATLWRLRVPRAYPSIYAGLKISAGLAVIGAVAGEFVAGGGLGALIDSARTQQRIDIVFGALICLSALGLAMIGALRLTHVLIQRVRPFGLHMKEI